MSLKKIYLFGYSGHALVVEDCVDKTQCEIVGYFDASENIENPLNIEYLGDESERDLKSIVEENLVFPAIGSNDIRKKVVLGFRNKGLNETTLQHDSSYVASSASIGNSSLVGPKAVVNPKAIIGDGVIINTSALIEHECVIGDFAHICPGTVLAGNVTIGSKAFIGANSTVKQGLSIGNNSVIGAGSVVLQDVKENEMWAGVPAKKIKDIE